MRFFAFAKRVQKLIRPIFRHASLTPINSGLNAAILNSQPMKRPMPNVLVAHSYFLRFDPKAWKQMRPYPPLGTLYAAAALRHTGHEVAVFDAMLARDEEEFRSTLESFRPDIVLFYEDNFNYLSKMCLTRMREACFQMAREAKRQNCFVIAQGSDPVDHLPEYFSNSIDTVIIGEGEKTAVELINTVAGGTIANVAGIAFLHDGAIVRSAERSLIIDLDSLPFPAWDLVDMNAYRDVWLKKHGYFSLNIVTTRGCPFHCNWCAKPVYGQVYHSRSPENVVSEMRLLQENYAPDHLWFCDDILGLKPGWMQRFAELVDEYNCRIPFSCQTRVDLMLKEDNVSNMERAGAETVWIGAESGSQKILNAMEKGISIEEIIDATKQMQRKSIRVAWFLQFGYPGEEEEDIGKTLRMLRDATPDDIGISVSYPLPGTTFYENVKATMGVKQNWKDSADLAVLFPGAFQPAFYRALHKAIHREFRLRQGLRTLMHFHFSGINMRRVLLLPFNAVLLLLHRVEMQALKRRNPWKDRIPLIATDSVS